MRKELVLEFAKLDSPFDVSPALKRNLSQDSTTLKRDMSTESPSTPMTVKVKKIGSQDDEKSSKKQTSKQILDKVDEKQIDEEDEDVK